MAACAQALDLFKAMLNSINRILFWRCFLWGIVIFFAGMNYYLFDMRRDLAQFISEEAALSEVRAASFEDVRKAPKNLDIRPKFR
jgi:hypothetical protein